MFAWLATGFLLVWAAGSAQHQHGNPPPVGVSSETPVWSPDGRLIAFSAGPWMRHQIYVMNVDGTGARRLTAGEQNRWPSWSPDGKFLVEMPGQKQQIFSIRPDGSDQRRLDGDHLYYGRLSFHPDGSRVFVAAHRAPAAVAGDRWKVRSRLYAVDPERQTIVPLGDEGYESNPWPSQDGRTLVVDTGDGRSWASDAGQWDLWLVDADHQRRTRLTSTDANDWGAAWSPDGKQIVFSSGRNRVYALQVINADGTGRRALTRTDRPPDQAVQPR